MNKRTQYFMGLIVINPEFGSHVFQLLCSVSSTYNIQIAVVHAFIGTFTSSVTLKLPVQYVQSASNLFTVNALYQTQK